MKVLIYIVGTVALLTLAIFVGVRFALLLAIGIGLGFVLERLGFGFAGPWRRLISERDGRGVIAQCWAIGLTALFIQPLIATSGSLIGAIGPVSLTMAFAAFVFGIAMQIVLGCGSGTLVNAGSGNFVALIALPAFCVGSFVGTLVLPYAINATPHQPVDLADKFGLPGGLLITQIGLITIAMLAYRYSTDKGVNRKLMIAATWVATLAILHVVVAGQPWGVVYGLGLWGAKIALSIGWDPSLSVFWSAPVNAESLTSSVLNDTTSLTSIGLMGGAALASFTLTKGKPLLPKVQLWFYFVVILSGICLGVSSRLAFGCNVGALFSGIASGSLHGWIWLITAFMGSIVGVRWRDYLWRRAQI